MTGTLQRRAAPFALFVLLAFSSCGSDDNPTRPKPVEPPTILAVRLETAWETEDATEYAKIVTGDFRFHFSIATDPELVDQYGNNWGLDDEIVALGHLFHGFTNTSGELIPGASNIDLTLGGVVVEDDPAHADSAAYYRKLVVTQLDGTIEVPGFTDPIFYTLGGRQELLLVRGDAAVLPDGAAGDPTRWYLREWNDLATPFASRKGPATNPASGATLGSMRSSYR